MKSTLGAHLPDRSRVGDAGYNFYLPKDVRVWGRLKSAVIDTGIIMEDGDIPEGYVMLLFPRSSAGMKYGLRFDNSIGVIDSGYRDTIKAKVTCKRFTLLKQGDRYFQGVIVPYATIKSENPPTEIRKGGLGSTGN